MFAGANVRGSLSYAVAVAIVLGGVAGAVFGPGSRLIVPLGYSVPFAFAFTPVGLFLLRHRSANPLSWLTWAAGVIALAHVAATAWSGTVVGAWAVQWAWWPPVGLMVLILLGFPAGEGIRTPRGVVIAALVGSSTALLAAAAVTAPWDLLTATDVERTSLSRVLMIAAAGLMLPVLVYLLVVVVGLFRRARVVGGYRRAQFVCLLPAAVLLPVGIALDAVGLRWTSAPGIVAFPLGVAVAILRFRLDDLDLLVRRGAVHLAGIATVTVVYALVVQVAARGVGFPVSWPLVAVVALAAAALDPLRRLANQRLTRALFGLIDDPFRVVTTVGAHLAADGPQAGLQRACEELVKTLQIPFAAIELGDQEEQRVVAWHGREGIAPLLFPLTSSGRRLGSLQASPRRAGESFTRREQRMLTALAQQVAAVAESLRLELARRQALTNAAELQTRLHQDLHDQIGPALTGAALTLAVSRQGTHDQATLELLGQAASSVEDARIQLRTFVRGLRDNSPGPAQGSVGLHDLERRLSTLLVGMDSFVMIDPAADLLSDEQAEAFTLVAAEAVSNAARHAGATRCQVILTVDPDTITLTVKDNGRGNTSGSWTPGVGLGSMSRRMTDIGGHLHILPSDAGSTILATTSR